MLKPKSSSPKKSSQQRGKTSLFMLSRFVASIILGAFFFNTGVFPIRLVIKTTADELPADYKFKAPQTVNITSEKTKDFEGYNNALKQEIPEDSEHRTSKTGPVMHNNSRVLNSASSDLQLGTPTTIDTTIPVVISNLMKSYQQRILASNFLKQASNFLKALYTTNPNTNGTIALLFNNENYLRLRREAEDKKRKALSNNLKNKNRKLSNLKDLYLKTLQNLKNKYQQTLTQWQTKKSTLNNKLNQVKTTLNSIQQKLNNIPSLKDQLKLALANFNYFQRKEDEHRRAYDSERREYKHDKKKYKKYKKKYKKKHKSKYKHRYKKYKKKYKKHKHRAEVQQRRYRDYEKQKNQAWQEYQALLVELDKKKSYQEQIANLTKEKINLQTSIENLNTIKPIDTTTAEVNQAKESYARGIVEANNHQRQREEEIEITFQEDLNRAEVYREEISNFFANSPLFFLTRAEQDTILRGMQEKIVDGKTQAQERIETRYQATRQTAQAVFLGLLSTPSKLLQSIKSKIATASKYLAKIRKKVDKLEDIYKETKAYKKKMKKYKKKYEKYSKKAKKAHGKKRKKYVNKRESAKKKYEKYLKKYNKYYGLKKAYKSGAKQADKIKDSYQAQYNYLINLEKQLQANYNDSLAYATKVKNQILTQGEKEKKESLNLLELISPWDYKLIAQTDNEDLKQYLSLINDDTSALDNINNLNIDFEAGLTSLKSLDKSFDKLRHKAKKAYKKAVKKARKEEAKRIAKIKAQQEQARRAYYQKLANQRAEEARQAEIQRQNTHYDQYGNGYSSQYNSYYSDRVINPSNTITKSSWFNYRQTTSSKFSWKFLLGATAYASTIKTESYKPKKSWWDKTKEWVGSKLNTAWNGAMDIVAPALSNTWEVIRKGTSNAVDNLVNTGGVIGNVIGNVARFLGNTVKNLWHDGTSIIVEGVKNLKTDLTTFAVGVGAWYNKKREDAKIKRVQFLKKIEDGLKDKVIEFLVGTKLPDEAKPYAQIAEHVYGNGEVSLPDNYTEITDRETLLKYGLTPELLENTETGLKASVYFNKRTGKLVIAFAGTNPLSLRDWLTNLKQGFGFETKQYQNVKAIANIIKKQIDSGLLNPDDISFVGHSLGGGEASYGATITHTKAYIFNAAGLHENTLMRAGIDDADNYDFSNITNYVNYDDGLTYFQEDSVVKFLAPDAIGNEIKYGSRINTIIPGFTLGFSGVGKLLEVANGIRSHGGV